MNTKVFEIEVWIKKYEKWIKPSVYTIDYLNNTIGFWYYGTEYFEPLTNVKGVKLSENDDMEKKSKSEKQQKYRIKKITYDENATFGKSYVPEMLNDQNSWTPLSAAVLTMVDAMDIIKRKKQGEAKIEYIYPEL